MPERRIGKFELLDELGQGGMGVVYRARDVRLDRLVALKLMRPDRAPDASSRARFLRECRAVAALNHPGIATLFEADETADGTLYFAAELVAGRTLAGHLRDGPVPLDRGLDYGVQLAAALAAAHEQGIVHRDIKPSNLMVTPDGRVKVLDFGLAHLATRRDVPEPDAQTRTLGATAVVQAETIGAVLGTPGYMAPEQILQQPAGPAADVFAAGVVLYELATGARPFSGATLEERMWQILHASPPPADRANRRVPAALTAVIARCLEKDPAERYRNGGELLQALSRCRPGHGRVGWWTWGAAAAAGLALVLGLWWSQRDTLAFSSRDRILIADVVNQTTEDVFGGALGTALEVDLRQSQYALVVERRDIAEALRLTRRPPDTTLDLATALDLARWVGAKAVLAPSIADVGGTYRLEATLYATASASPVAVVSVVARGRDAVLRDAVDELTAAVRKRLGESLAEIEQDDAPIIAVTTGSWDALEALRLGLQSLDEWKWPEAAAFFEEALRRDTEFAAAKGQLGLVLIQFLNQGERGRQFLLEASAASDRLSHYERVMLDGLIMQFVNGNLEAALQQFKMAASLFPARTEPFRNQGIIFRATGRFTEAAEAFRESHLRAPKSAGPLELLWFVQVGPVRDPAGAEETARKLIALRPDDPNFAHMLGWSYLAQLRFADAEERLSATLAEHPDHTRSRVNLAHLTLRSGDTGTAVERYRDVLTDVRAGRIQQDTPSAVLWLATALMAAGRPDEAGPLFDEAARAMRTPALRARLDATRGRTREALKTLGTLPPLEKLDFGQASAAASAWAFAGDPDRALAALAHALRLNSRDVYYTLILPDYRPLWTDDRFARLVTTGAY